MSRMQKKFRILFVLLVFGLFCLESGVCQDELSSEEMVVKAWEMLAKKDYDGVITYVDKGISLYAKKAAEEQACLKDYAPSGSEDNYKMLNSVGIFYFIKGEALMAQGKWDEAREAFNTIINKYRFSQYWDPKGWYWKPDEISKINLKKIENLETEKKIETGKKVAEQEPLVGTASIPHLYEVGKEKIVNYEKYGQFREVGTPQYSYRITNRKGLAQAVGEGIYPNNSVWRDPRYKEVKSEGRLKGSHWDFLNIPDLEASFYKWATAGEEPGVKQYYVAFILAQAGLVEQAVKAYYAVVVNFPKCIGWTYWHTPWYPGKSAIDTIRYFCRTHPQLGMKLVDANITIEGAFDNDIRNDKVVAINPGRIISCKGKECKPKRIDTAELSVKRIIGKGRVQLAGFENGDWQLIVNGRPYLVKAVAYTPNRVGQSPDEGTLEDWMQADYDNNGKIDGPYDAWVDKNFNNLQDPDEPATGDFQLMKDMGVNTIRIYHHASNKDLLMDLYRNYGIMVMMGDFLGMYATGSGASWYAGTDYRNAEQKENMMNSVRNMVMEFKDEPYILMWALGNENNYGVACNANKFPEDYYKFVNEVSLMIKSIDPDHPVVICNGETQFLEIIAINCPDIDIFGCNSYRGSTGFEGTLFEDVKEVYGKPVIITEYGCPAYAKGRSRQEAEELQAAYLKATWEGIMFNTAGCGAGNAIGGVLFEWLDEWWKAYEPSLHDYKPLWAGPFPDGWMHEEWLGICSQGDGSDSPYLRQLRKSYYTYQELWKK